MKKYYFLDEWILDGYRDLYRVFPKAQPFGCKPITGISTKVIKDKDTGKYLCWKEDEYFDKGKNKIESILSFSKSDDGTNWCKSSHPGKIDSRYPERHDSIEFERKLGETVIYDEHDEDPERRYKSVSGDGYILTSPDGFNWKMNKDMKWDKYLTDSYSDCVNHIIWNPVTGKYQITCRPIMADRRIALVQSEDLYNWSEPMVILHPDAMDEALTQLYGLYQCWTGDIFIGLLQKFRVPHEERRWEHKMYGFTTTELVYSYNGINWIRPNRASFFEHPEPPELGSNSIYGGRIIDEGDYYRIYSNGSIMHDGDHDDYKIAGEPTSAVLVHKIRKDGFAYMETIGGWGIMWTRSIRPAENDFTVNYKAVNRNSKVFIQLLGNDWKPLPGFTFDDFVPMSGDEIAGKPKWKGKDVSELKGKICKVEFKLFDARIYSFSWTSEIIYGPSLTREFIEKCMTREGRILMRPEEGQS